MRMSRSQSGLECAPWPSLLGSGEYHLTGSPVQCWGVQLPRVWEGHGVVAGLVSLELKPSAVSIHDCLLVKTF